MLKATPAEEHAWEFTTDTNTRAAYQKYLERFPQGFYTEKARGFLAEYEGDETAWEFANDAGTDQAIQKYMKKYPNGLHAVDARKRIDPFHELMVFVKGGTFEMGDVFDEEEEYENPAYSIACPRKQNGNMRREKAERKGVSGTEKMWLTQQR